MKYLVTFLFTILFSANLLAENLCDASCKLVITFPDGGSIEANDSLTITFGSNGGLNTGDTGTINTNPQPADQEFLNGGTLLLASGDSITFDANGSLDLGEGGNLEYSDLIINTTGDVLIEAEGGPESLVIQNLVISGSVHILFSAEIITVNGALSVGENSTLTLVPNSDDIDAVGCSLQDSNATLSISSGVVLSTSDTCQESLQVLDYPDATNPVLTEISLSDNNNVIFSSGTGLLAIPDVPVFAGDIIFNPDVLTPELMASLSDGTVLEAKDGNKCTLDAGECITTDGVSYKVVDGELVPETKSGGLINGNSLILLLLFWALVKLMRLRVLNSSS